MLENGLKLLMILITINAVLMASGVLQVGASSAFYSWMPGILQTYGQQLYPAGDWNSSTSVIRTDVNASASTSSTNVLPIIGDAVSLALSFWDLITMLLFGFIFAMQAANMPALVIFIFGVPLALFEIITLLYLAVYVVSAITGSG